MDTVGERLRALMEYEKLKQVAMARIIGVVSWTMNAWMENKSLISSHHGRIIAEKFQVPLDWLYGTIDNVEYMTVKDAKNLYEAMNKTTEGFKKRRIRELHRELKELTNGEYK